MKLENKESNYSASIVRIDFLHELEGLDNLKAFRVQGMQALVSKENKVGDLGIIFPAECKLSDDFCRNNNLYRKSELNKDESQTGYLENNCRIKALKLRKNISTALYIPLSGLDYLVDTSKFKEGDSFTHINGQEICKKYKIQYQIKKSNKTRGLKKKYKRIDNTLFPEYIDTDNYFRNKEKYQDDDYIVCTLKLHGSSGRFANQKVRKFSYIQKFIDNLDEKIIQGLDRRSKIKSLNKLKRFIKDVYVSNISNKLIPMIPFKEKYEYECLAGSRRVIKDNSGNNDHYYNTDIWNHHLEEIKHLIPKNTILYGEIIGWSGDSQIQKNYTYKIPKGKSELYIYRISSVNEDGFTHVWDWDSTKHFCINNEIKFVPEIWRGYHKDFDVDSYMNKKFVKDLGLMECLLLDSKAPCDEGLVIRNLKNYVTKAKSPEFLLHETKQLDSGEIDIESQESEVEEDN